MERFASFLWTLPVPWAGFTRLSPDPETAATQSRTIRYQRERTRRWVAEQGGALIREEVFLELAPDRGSAVMVPALDRLRARAAKESARVILVRFREVHGWRAHQFLQGWVEAHPDVVALDPVPLGGEDPFDPLAHFRAWAMTQESWTGSRQARRAAIVHALDELGGQGITDVALAERLNARGVVTVTGKAWTAETVRKARRARRFA